MRISDWSSDVCSSDLAFPSSMTPMTELNYDPLWLAIGFLGQAFFTMRFGLQWFASERAKRSVIPIAFWYFSLLGGATLRSEERRGGKEWVGTCRSRWWP